MSWRKLCGNRTAHWYDDPTDPEPVSACGRARYDRFLLVPAKLKGKQRFCSYCRKVRNSQIRDEDKVVDLAEYRRRKLA